MRLAHPVTVDDLQTVDDVPLTLALPMAAVSVGAALLVAWGLSRLGFDALGHYRKAWLAPVAWLCRGVTAPAATALVRSRPLWFAEPADLERARLARADRDRDAMARWVAEHEPWSLAPQSPAGDEDADAEPPIAPDPDAVEAASAAAVRVARRHLTLTAVALAVTLAPLQVVFAVLVLQYPSTIVDVLCLVSGDVVVVGLCWHFWLAPSPAAVAVIRRPHAVPAVVVAVGYRRVPKTRRPGSGHRLRTHVVCRATDGSLVHVGTGSLPVSVGSHLLLVGEVPTGARTRRQPSGRRAGWVVVVAGDQVHVPVTTALLRVRRRRWGGPTRTGAATGAT